MAERDPRRIEIAGASHVGYVRQNNEDTYRDAVLPDGRALLVVADGMGGHAAGEVASALAVEAVVERLAAGAPDDAETALDAAVRAAHVRVLAAAAENAARRGMGTTLTVALAGDAAVHFCHVGDSRLYHWAPKALRQVSRDQALPPPGLRQVSRDQTLAEELLAAGEIDRDGLEYRFAGTQLLQAIGSVAVGEALAPQTGCFEWAPGDRLLLCSDGLTDMLADAEIAAILAASSKAGDTADSLLRSALDAGGRDNVTVLVAALGGRA